ncbi:MAG: amidohydrolase [Clostridiales bacterium]|jgi:imidazolonepropionase-like amidohydrolase|nr:amidohydrolase [Clostridiales bacterium]
MLIINAVIHTMAGTTLEHGFIETEGRKIKRVGTMSELTEKEKADALDLNGGSVYPGFIDTHTHLGLIGDALGFESDDLNEMTNPVTPQLRAIDAINPLDYSLTEAVRAGVTTVVTGPGSANPIAGQMAAIKTHGVCVDDMIIKAPLAIKMALGENPKSVYHSRKESPSSRMATAAVIRDALAKAKEYLRKKQVGEEQDFDFSCEALIPLLKGEIPAHIHAHREDDILTAARLSKEFGFDYIIVHGTRGHLIANRLKQENIRIMSGPLLCDRSKPELKDLTPAAPAILKAEDIEVSIVTDHPVIPIQYLPLCAGLAAREGLSKEDALRAITIDAARIANIADYVGSIEVGKDADFSVFDSDPLTISAKPRMVFINGERVF